MRSMPPPPPRQSPVGSRQRPHQALVQEEIPPPPEIDETSSSDGEPTRKRPRVLDNESSIEGLQAHSRSAGANLDSSNMTQPPARSDMRTDHASHFHPADEAQSDEETIDDDDADQLDGRLSKHEERYLQQVRHDILTSVLMY